MVTRGCGGRPPPRKFAFTSVGFTDGAVRGGAASQRPQSRMGGGPADGDGIIQHGLYGSCPDSFPTSLRVELWGFLKMLELAMPPLTIWVDNARMVDGWHKGPTWCTAAALPAADLWREVWRLLDDIGGGIQIRKCKGHATSADVAAGRSTAFLQQGNAHADHYAGGGLLAQWRRAVQHPCAG